MQATKTSSRRPRHVALASLCLLSLPSSNQAFSPPRCSHVNCITPIDGSATPITSIYNKRRRTAGPRLHRPIIFSATIDLDSVSESTEPLSPDVLSVVPNLSTIDAHAQQHHTMNNDVSTIQSRTFDRDAFFNISIFLLAIGTAAFHVLSVDVGITRGWGPEEIALRIPLDNWRSYTNILNMAPIQTKAITSATVYTIGDIIAQRKGGAEIGKLDRARIARSMAAGFIGHGPMSHVWYHVSEDFFDNVLQLHAWWDFIPKVVVDQTVFGPIWNNSYIILLGLMQFQKPSQIWSDMKRTTIPLIISGLKLWPFVHCITYGLIPVENRLLWVDAVEILWVTILADQASGDVEEEALRVSDETLDGGESLVNAKIESEPAL